MRRYRHEIGVGLYVIVYLVTLAFVTPGGSGVLSGLNNVLYFGMGAVTIWSQLQVARRAGTDRRTRRGWYLLAASAACIVLGGVVWTALLAVNKSMAPLANLVLETTYIPLAIAAFLAFPVNPGFSLRDRRTLLDAALCAIGALALSWHFGILPMLQAPAGSVSLLDEIPIAGAWVVACAGSLALLRVASGTTRSAVGLALAGHLAFILTNYFWNRAGATYAPGDWVDALWFSAWVLRWASARRALHASVAAPAVEAAESRKMGPSLFVVGAYCLLLLALVNDPSDSAIDFALAATAMTTLLLIRQRVDLSENRRLTHATEVQAARFRSLVASGMDFVLVVAPTLAVRYASPSLDRVAGRLEGRSFVDALHPDDQEGMRRWLAGRRTSADARPFRCRLGVHDGSWRDVEFRAQDLRRDPEVQGFVINGRDISIELELEEQLGHARKLATLSDMSGRIAHAFNNTLAVLSGHAELLEQELPAESPAREDIGAIRAAAERGAGITRQLLGFNSRYVIRPELVYPHEVVTGLRPTLGRLLSRNVTLNIEGEAPTLAVRIDAAQFEQVVVNLVANARDGLSGVPQGGRVTVSVVERGSEVAIMVADDGVGIPDAVLPRIFEPFFTTKAPGRGTGLGLAMVASIVKRAGGRVEVASEAGHGTTFTIVLPAAVTEAEDAPAVPVPVRGETSPPHGTPASGVCHTVLLVDDDPLVRHTSRRMLELGGYQVLEAPDGAAALALAEDLNQQIDLLLTDLLMPGLSGTDVIAGFRPLRPGVPIVCVTGFAAEQEGGSALALQVHAIVAKPFTMAVLNRAITEALQP
jgi:PAS domain S-box-containing protein